MFNISHLGNANQNCNEVTFTPEGQLMSKYVENQDSYIAGRNVNWCNHRKTVWKFLKWLNNHHRTLLHAQEK